MIVPPLCTSLWASYAVDVPESIEIRKEFRCKFGRQIKSDAMQNVSGCIDECVAVAAKLRQDLGWLETQAAVTYVTYVTVADAGATAKGRELRTHRLSLR